jgi:hypothetical protein
MSLADIQALKALKIAMAGKKRITAPSGISYTPPFNVYKDKNNTFYTDFDITRFFSSFGLQSYYVAPNGSDSNSGTQSSPFSTFSKAYNMPDVGIIYMKYGTYDRGHGFAGATISKNISVLAIGGEVKISAHDTLTWSVVGGYTNTYQSTRSTVDGVWDAKTPDANGDYTRLTKQTSIALVDANPGSWYSDGTTVYVRTSDSRTPDSNIRVYLAVLNGYINSGTATVFLDGITFEGGTEPLKISNANSTTRPTVYANNCKFKYGTSNNGVTSQGALTYFVGCEAVKNNLDGFNYHIWNNLYCTSIEINCTGRNNGYTGLDNNNGSTTHDGNTVVRINGTYYGNQGPNVVDINSAKSWNVGCTAYNSAAGTSGQNSNYSGEASMWLDNCVSYGSTYDIAPLTSTPGMYINIRNMKGLSSLSNSNLIIPYY